MPDLPTTQRAYTLRLRGVSPDDHSWRETLWKTHVAVNRGAKAFGDWLLTLRGGLCHALADAKVPVGKGKPDREPTEAERRHRRIILALSWLSVESHETERDAPVAHFVLVRDGVPQSVEALRTILKDRGVAESEIGDWLRDCGDSLRASIRESAVWVNRSRAFDTTVKRIGSSLNRAEIWDVFDRFFGDADSYLGTADAPVNEDENARQEDAENGEADAKPAADDKAKDLVIKAGGWLSNRFGEGEGADFTAIAGEYEAFTAWCRTVIKAPSTSASAMSNSLTQALNKPELSDRLAATSGPSNKVQTAFERIVASLNEDRVPEGIDFAQLATWSDEQVAKKRSNVGGKGHREWTDALLRDVEAAGGFTYIDTESQTARHWEFSVMLDHAARRVSQTHSWIKLAEGERNEFEKDARKIDKLKREQSAIVEWLDQFCRDRSRDTGTADDDGYRIRKGAISDWSDVVTRWGSAKCKTVDDRITVAREVQADPENDKPGDNQLYEALAQVEAKLVWFVDGQPNAQPLKDYVVAREAEHNKRRFKVPAYRHPDELRHPVFCDFGESRWSIDFAAHRVGSKLASAQATVERRQADAAKALLTIEKAKTDEKRAAAQEKLVLAQRSLDESQRELAWLQSQQGLRMKLWDGHTLEDRSLSWQSKRLRNELTEPGTGSASRTTGEPGGVSPRTSDEQQVRGLTPSGSPNPVPVTRGNRLALAAGNAKAESQLDVMGLLGLKEWNGRLQAPRAELDRIADIRDGVKRKKLSATERQARVDKMIARLHWLVTYSARLQPQGPWMDYAKAHPDLAKPDPQYWPHAAENKSRKGKARLLLSRLPNLRVLSVDLGHRYAAACAVWEAISTQEIQAACVQAGCGVPSRKALYWFVPRGKQGRVVYRRIADDTLPDGLPHPAPWARLDRQFLIKLQGEDEPARMTKLGDADRRLVETLEGELGYQRREPRRAADWRIDELMSDAVRTVRLALRNHGDYARIAGGMIAEERPGMGNRSPVKLEDDTLVEHLVGLLDIWHELANSSRWQDEFAHTAWEQHIEPRLTGITLEEDTEEMTGSQRKAVRSKRREQLKSVAERLANEDRMKLHIEWQQAWATRDEQWRKRLRWLSRWIMPRGKKKDRSIRHVGGLSLNRIATFKSLYQVQKAFFTRQKPDGKKPDPAGQGFGQRTLDALERMRQNRVKQLASRIAEAALGVGIERSRTEKGKQLQRPRERIADPRFAPCHAVVIENLTHYRPDELQTRRENRQLMTWASAQVKKHLTDQCQLHGLHLREVQPGYTSRQDFRTGAPGVRCVDVPVAEFLGDPNGKSGRHVRQAIKNLLKDIAAKDEPRPDDWLKRLELARDKARAKSGTAWDRYVVDLFDHLRKPTDLPANKSASRFARIPQKGGDIFVGADNIPSQGSMKGPPGVQADLNAAGNIGLKALLDPDWHGAWWYIPAGLDADGWRVPAEKSTAGAACLKDWNVGEVKSGHYQSEIAGGRPLNRADDEQVQAASKLVEEARAKWDSAKAESKAAKKGQRGKSLLSHEAALELEVAAKAAHDEAKKNHAAAKKGANAKSVVNLWRFLSRQRPHDCEWHEYAAYENLVRWRAIRVLRQLSEGLPRDDE